MTEGQNGEDDAASRSPGGGERILGWVYDNYKPVATTFLVALALSWFGWRPDGPPDYRPYFDAVYEQDAAVRTEASQNQVRTDAHLDYQDALLEEVLRQLFEVRQDLEAAEALEEQRFDELLDALTDALVDIGPVAPGGDTAPAQPEPGSSDAVIDEVTVDEFVPPPEFEPPPTTVVDLESLIPEQRDSDEEFPLALAALLVLGFLFLGGWYLVVKRFARAVDSQRGSHDGEFARAGPGLLERVPLQVTHLVLGLGGAGAVAVSFYRLAWARVGDATVLRDAVGSTVVAATVPFLLALVLAVLFDVVDSSAGVRAAIIAGASASAAALLIGGHANFVASAAVGRHSYHLAVTIGFAVLTLLVVLRPLLARTTVAAVAVTCACAAAVGWTVEVPDEYARRTEGVAVLVTESAAEQTREDVLSDVHRTILSAAGPVLVFGDDGRVRSYPSSEVLDQDINLQDRDPITRWGSSQGVTWFDDDDVVRLGRSLRFGPDDRADFESGSSASTLVFITDRLQPAEIDSASAATEIHLTIDDGTDAVDIDWRAQPNEASPLRPSATDVEELVLATVTAPSMPEVSGWWLAAGAGFALVLGLFHQAATRTQRSGARDDE